MAATVRVLIVDDHEVFADALTVCLGDYPDLEVVGVATTASRCLALVAAVDLDIVVLDLALAGEDGLTVAREVLALRPYAGIVVATGIEPDGQVVDAVQLGVRGWVPKTASAETLVDAIRGVSRGETRIPAQLLANALMSMSRDRPELLAGSVGMSELTGRELEVLGCLVEGMSRTEIGDLLHVSPNTVRTHVQSILHKLQVHSALAAVSIARRAGVNGVGVPAG
ncbi:response regulator transcription factor [Nostocoides sp. HKS02]|uniref:response regulator n=1 Tax=Nostocoides sp. HKS02 TaxID=1813880 RepID=UPI0018A84402|nr:response regulator transcription factor [Tetrasphaera sp. HKS02]